MITAMEGSRVETANVVEGQRHDNKQGAELHRADSTMSQSHTLTPSRGGTLKKRQSLSRKYSNKRGSSRKGSRPGSVKDLTFADDVAGHESEMHSAFFTPVPTSGSPTEILANRFQVWRKVLKDLITYFRDIQKSYEARSKSLYTLSNVISNITAPPELVISGGISDAIHVLRDYHKQSITEGNKAKSIEDDVITQLTGLRSDLAQKVKEIKGLSGDFKNNVDKETEGTRRAVRDLQDALGSQSTDPKSDPYLVRLATDRQVGRQIEEENYLHRAFLNLESSGRELESIVMGEIQKAYNAYTGIIKREADEAYEAVGKLRNGPLAIPKDFEWNAFVDNNEHFVDPRLPIRRVENIKYPGKDEAAASEVKAGMLERKSKYLKSYTPGWYVLSTTHLHEFKSPDRIASQTPVMSLALVDQKLGSHSNQDSTSHKFMLKGRQSGGIHRGHAWVFRAESYDTMLAWFSDIKNLTEKTGAERNAFIQRSHARSLSAGSHRAGSISSDGMEEDEADQVPYSATPSQADISAPQEKFPDRPNPGGRFPSALTINRNSQVPLSPSSNESSGDHQIVAAAGALPGSGVPFGPSGYEVQAGDDETNITGEDLSGASGAELLTKTRNSHQQSSDLTSTSPVQTASAEHGAESSNQLKQAQELKSPEPGVVAYGEAQAIRHSLSTPIGRNDSKYGDWMGSAAGRTGGATIGSAGIEIYSSHQDRSNPTTEEDRPALQATDLQSSASMSEDVQESVRRSDQSAASSAVPSAPQNVRKCVTNADLDAPLTGAGWTARLNEQAEPIRESGEGAKETERPSLATRVNTISDLHLPGEFPRGKSLADPL